MAKTLILDTSDSKKISVELDCDGVKSIAVSVSSPLKSEAALPLIDRALSKNNLNIREIDKVVFNTGPGSFTGLRVGAAIANTLGFILKIPVNGRQIGESGKPVYNK